MPFPSDSSLQLHRKNRTEQTTNTRTNFVFNRRVMGHVCSTTSRRSPVYTCKFTSSQRDRLLQDLKVYAREGRRKGTKRLGVVLLEKGAFSELMQRRFGITAELAECFFLAFDLNHDGFVDFLELATGMSILCKGNKEEKISFLFKLFDRDGDGTISLEEVREAIQLSLAACEKLLSVHNLSFHDLNFVSQVDDSDYINTSLEQSFRALDADHDGKLNAREFSRFVRDNTEIAQFLEYFDGLYS
ncbi:hypothetical protein Pelo_5547 [Pelomyxa schiedti]|nr:hypothetical protein Pelo_5547 [Pelomyxa schiedti]